MDQLSWGLSQERQDFMYRVIGSQVFVDIWVLDDNGDIDIKNWTQYVSGVERTLDCTTGLGLYGQDGLGGTGAARIEIPQGTPGDPKLSYIYCTYDEQTAKLDLAVSEIEPISQIGLICKLAIEGYADVSAHPPIVFQRLTQSLQHDLQSILGYLLAKVRDSGATYSSGMDPDFTITTNAGSLDTVELNISTGIGKQINPQITQPIFSLTDTVHVWNVSGNGVIPHNNYRISNLGELLELADGTVIADGNYVNFTFWMATNHGHVSHLCVNLPDGVYTSANDAKNDINDYGFRTLPQIAGTVGQLICQTVLRYNSADSGTWSNALSRVINSVKTESRVASSPSYPYYGNGEDNTITLTKAGATKIRVHFRDFDTEANYDYVTIRNGANTQQTRYHGNLGSFSSLWVSGDTIKLQFTSDGSVTRKGYYVDYIEYETTSQTGKEVKDLRGTLSGN